MHCGTVLDTDSAWEVNEILTGSFLMPNGSDYLQPDGCTLQDTVVVAVTRLL